MKCAVDGCDRTARARDWCSSPPNLRSARLGAHRVGPRSANCRARGRTLTGGISMANGTCAIHGCERQARSRGWCGTHYERWRKHGSTADPRPSVEDRFWAKVDVGHPLGCWEWTGSKTRRYGAFWLDGQKYAHRVAFTLLRGPIPDGLTLDHLCRNPPCVNPDHLEAVTQGENVARGNSPPARHGRKTQCVNGHEFTPENTYTRPDGTGRHCRACMRGSA